MPCSPECIKTASLGPGKGRIVLSQDGNWKYPIPHTPHEQCPDCVAVEYAELMKDIQALKDRKVLGTALSAKWGKLEEKVQKAIKK
jgi:hypothetical protein